MYLTHHLPQYEWLWLEHGYMAAVRVVSQVGLLPQKMSVGRNSLFSVLVHHLFNLVNQPPQLFYSNALSVFCLFYFNNLFISLCSDLSETDLSEL